MLLCHISSLSQQPGKQNSSYWAHSCNHWMNLLCAAAVVCESFFEEEVDFGIIGVSAIWDNMSIHKNRLWKEKVYQKDETKSCISVSNKWFDVYWLLQGSAEYSKYQQVNVLLAVICVCILKFYFSANFQRSSPETMALDYCRHSKTSRKKEESVCYLGHLRKLSLRQNIKVSWKSLEITNEVHK